MKIALISVYNKNGIIELSKYLLDKNYKIISTGGTARYLQENNIPITQVSDFINYPEILNGRVKTLHPKIFGGILANQDNQTDLKELKENNISLINLLIVNFYPVEKVISENKDIDTVIENIDIGGVALVRAAAKNFKWTLVLNSPDDYDEFIHGNENYGIEYRMRLAAKAFANTSKYDELIYNYFSQSTQSSQRKKDLVNKYELNLLTEKVIGMCIKIHKKIGAGLYESVYEEILCYELNKNGINFERQKNIPVIYEKIKLSIGFTADIIVENKIIIELKSIETILPVHKKQLLTYLKLSKIKIGLLINFNSELLKDGITRIIN